MLLAFGPGVEVSSDSSASGGSIAPDSSGLGSLGECSSAGGSFAQELSGWVSVLPWKAIRMTLG